MRSKDNSPPLGFARFLSWISLILILGCNIFLSVLITNQAREIMLKKQENFALLMAENINDQIYRRYTIPLFVGNRGLAFTDRPSQFEPLDQIIQSVVRGANVNSVRIFNYNSAVVFSMLQSETGRRNLASVAVEHVRNTDIPEFEFISKLPFWRSLFSLSPEPGTFMLRVIYPLNTQNRLMSFEGQGPNLDILEFSQDITSDYEAIIRFQWSILGATALSSFILFALLLLFLRRAEKALSERMLEKKRLEDELYQSEKLASMGRVISSIAHEIRNPLGIIRSSAELLLQRQKKAGNKEDTGLLEAIYDEACRLSRTITDFLDYARPKVIKAQPFDLNATLNQALVFLGNSLTGQNIATSVELPPQTMVNGDKDLLYRALYNILSNAAQALGQDGSIAVKGSLENSRLLLEISDNGPGFSEEAIKKALDPFFTTKDDGTGLGLAIVQSIIASHEGSIELSNVETGGARVRITLPVAEPTAKQ